jgi:hypothetical protein
LWTSDWPIEPVSFHTEGVYTTTNHPWLTADHGWLPAGFLHVGEPVRRADGGIATVVAIQVVPGVAAMWDLTVSHVHTFAVGVGEYVVHNCGVESGQVEYGGNRLSREVQGARKAAGDTAHNYAAAELDDGSILIGKSSKVIHAEEDILNQAGDRNIRALYSEFEPCAAKCAAKVAGIPNVSWTWAWNGADTEATNAIRGAARVAKDIALRGLFG